jgi:uncharacterized cupredoxin-like copper-binding protein
MTYRALSLLATAALLTSAGPAVAHGDEAPAGHRTYDATQVEDTAFGREGDPKKVVRTIQVDMADTLRFTPAHVTVAKGQTVRFVLRNRGHAVHEMVLGTVEELKEHAELMKRFPGMEHADPNMAHVKPGARGQIVWQFTRPGEFQFACLQPGHFEAGMVGKVTVE